MGKTADLTGGHNDEQLLVEFPRRKPSNRVLFGWLRQRVTQVRFVPIVLKKSKIEGGSENLAETHPRREASRPMSRAPGKPSMAVRPAKNGCPLTWSTLLSTCWNFQNSLIAACPGSRRDLLHFVELLRTKSGCGRVTLHFSCRCLR